MSAWISVKDRLPEKPYDVFVLDVNQRMAVAWYVLEIEHGLYPEDDRDIYIWKFKHDNIGLGEITHWTPLHNPPEEYDI